MKYRAEVDGLRAIAIIPVILFHAGFTTFSGGFIGVDVFFVISGYLITSIIIKETREERFSLLGFYERRARRILPPLFLVLFVSACIAWFLFLPNEMKIFSQTIASAASFLTNVYFYLHSSNYFGLASDLNPLLHLWSLAVEEQFYIFFPILMIFLLKMKGYFLYVFLLGLLIFSLGLSQWMIADSPLFSFYSLPTRGWELLIGSMLATNIVSSYSPKGSQLFSIVGLLLILLSVFILDRNTPFPGYYALIPTIGAALIIVFAKAGTVVHTLLSSKILVGIGLVSYSVYLWHQPLFAFSRLFDFDVTNYIVFIALVFLTFLLSIVSNVLIEKPIRNRSFLTQKTIFTSSLILMVIFSVLGVYGHFNNGYPARSDVFSRLQSNFGLSLACNGNSSISNECITGPEPEVAVYGNSFAMHLVSGLTNSFPKKGLVQLTQDTCEPFENIEIERFGKEKCDVFNKQSINTIVKTSSIRVVIISSPFHTFTSDVARVEFVKTINQLELAGKKVVVIGPPPSNGADHGKCFARKFSTNKTAQCNFPVKEVKPAYQKIMQQLRVVQTLTNMTLIDLKDVICDNSICNVVDGDVVIFRDRGHLSREGSRYVIDKVKHLLK
ncbi:MAG: acyltransferase family protein [Cocleimonas sp.]